MGVCSTCGATMNDGAAFCGNCGRPAAVSGTANFTPVPSPPPGTTGLPNNPGLTSNAAGALAYVLGFITGILFLILEPYKKDRFVRFHALQSIFFSIACILVHIAWGIVWGILIEFSGALFFLSAPLHLLLSLAFFALWLFVMFQAYQQKEYRIPILGALAAKQIG